MRVVKMLSAVVLVAAACGVAALQYGEWQHDAYGQSDPPQPPRATFNPSSAGKAESGSTSSDLLPPQRNVPERVRVGATSDFSSASTPPGGTGANSIPARSEPYSDPNPAFGTRAAGSVRKVELATTVHRLGHLDAAQVSEVLKTLFSDRPGFIVTAEPVTNTLIIRADNKALKDILQLVEQLEQTHRDAVAEADARAAEWTAEMVGIESDEAEIIQTEQRQLVENMVSQRLQAVRQQQMAESMLSDFAPADPDAAARRSALQESEQRSHAVARNLQAALTMYSVKHPRVLQLRQELREILEQAFERRLQAQEHEVAFLTERLATVQSRLRRRAELRERIIERRVNELTGNGDETLWDPAPMQRPQQAQEMDAFAPPENIPVLDETIPSPDLSTGPSAPDLPGRPSTLDGLLDTAYDPYAGGSETDLPLAEPAPLDLSLRQRLVESRLRHAVAEREYKRLQVLRANNVTTQTSLDRAQDIVRQTKAVHEETERLIKLQLKQLDTRISLARKSVEIARSQVKTAELTNEKVPGTIPLVEFLKIALEAERCSASLHELEALKSFLTDSLPTPLPGDEFEPPVDPEPIGIEQQPPAAALENVPVPGSTKPVLNKLELEPLPEPELDPFPS